MVENLVLTGTAANGTGNALDNSLTGNASATVSTAVGAERWRAGWATTPMSSTMVVTS